MLTKCSTLAQLERQNQRKLEAIRVFISMSVSNTALLVLKHVIKALSRVFNLAQPKVNCLCRHLDCR